LPATILGCVIIQNWWRLREELNMAALRTSQRIQSENRRAASEFESVVAAKLANEWLAMNSIPLRSQCLLECARGSL
jgi:hypothetical protein